MNKRTVLVLSTTMMSIATAACAFCVAQTANAAEVSTPNISGVSTAKVTTPPLIENSSSQETDASGKNGIKSSDSSDKHNIKPETNSKSNSDTKAESKLETKSDVKSGVKLDSNTNVNTVIKTTAKSNANSVVNTDANNELNIDSKSKVSEDSVSPTIFNQALFASGKPDPNHQQQQEKTELRVSLCWETMNDDNKNAFVTENSDFGQLNFKSWDFGSTLDSNRQDVKDAFAKIKFKIIDKTDNNKVVAETTGTYDPNTATYATKSLGSYDLSHTYEVSVVNSTVPSPYYVTYNNVSTNEDEAFDPDATYFTWTPSKGSNKTYQNKYFRLNVLEIVYAKDEDVAAKCFSYTQPQINNEYQSDGDWKFTYSSDNVFARLRVKDNAIQFPKTNPTKAGYKFVGWQFYVAKKKNGKPYTSYDRMSDDDKKIIKSTTVVPVPFNAKTTTYPYLFAVLRDNKGVNTFGSMLGTQYCTTNHTFVVFPKWEKEAGHTVTFINEGSEYAKVKVQAGESISAQVMPTNPSKYGYSFMGWNTQADGTGSAFLAGAKVDNDMTVYSIYKNYSPTLTLQDKTITEGEQLDLKTLVVSAKDSEDGDITSKVKLTDNGGFDNTKVGSYKITFSVTDNGGATVTASATVTVTKKPTPPTPPTPPEPEPTPVPEPEQELEPAPAPAPDQPDQPEQPKQQKQPEAKHAAKHLPKTGSTATPVLASAIASLFAGIAGFAESFAANRKRKN